jgi:hypothetical protein
VGWVAGERDYQSPACVGRRQRSRAEDRHRRYGDVHQHATDQHDATMAGMQITPAGPMGAANGINFQPTAAGDEVNPLIRTLRSNGIEVPAIHSHMLDEQPRMFFIHFWANDDAIRLAKGIRAALDQTAVAKS